MERTGIHTNVIAGICEEELSKQNYTNNLSLLVYSPITEDGNNCQCKSNSDNKNAKEEKVQFSF